MRRKKTTTGRYRILPMANVEKIINPDNVKIHKDFVSYLKYINRTPSTIAQYAHDLKIFWTWNYKYNDDKYFPKILNRDFIRMQSTAMNDWGWSTSRMTRFKCALGALSKFVQEVMVDEIGDYDAPIKQIKNPVKQRVKVIEKITPNELEYVLSELVNQRKYQSACIIAIVAYGNLTRAEIPHVKYRYFDSENILYNAMYRTPEPVECGTSANKQKNKKIRYILIDFRKYFDLWMAVRQGRGIKNEYLFVTNQKRRSYTHVSTKAIDQSFEYAKAILGKPVNMQTLKDFVTPEMLGKYHVPLTGMQEFFGKTTPVMNDVYLNDEFTQYCSDHEFEGLTPINDGNIPDPRLLDMKESFKKNNSFTQESLFSDEDGV